MVAVALGVLTALAGVLVVVHTVQASEVDAAARFRWIRPTSDPQLWQHIQSAFHDELTPDEPKPGQDPLDVYRYKYLQRCGIVGHSALVVVGHQPTKQLTKENEWDVYSSAYNFDLATGQKSAIRQADWMWQWKFRWLARFGPSRVPDVTFNYLTCTECEPDFMFGSFYYDSKGSAWQARSWGDGKQIWWAAKDGLVVDMDLDKDDVISYDCVYGPIDSKASGFQDLCDSMQRSPLQRWRKGANRRPYAALWPVRRTA